MVQKYLARALIALLLCAPSVTVFAQAAPVTVDNLTPAVSPLSGSDEFWGWQAAQTPHTRKMTVNQIIGNVVLNLTAWTCSNTNGTVTCTPQAQNANTVYAGPSSGAAAVPTFRALIGSDLPNPSGTTLGGVESIGCPVHQWISIISTAGVPSCAQPNFTDLAGTLSTSMIAANAVTNAALAQAPANTVKGNPTGATANEQDLAVPTCSGGFNALIWNSGFGCNTISPTSASGFVNILRDNSLSDWAHGTTGTITTAGGYAAEGVYIIPTGASVSFSQLTTQQPGFYALQLQGATGITDLQARFVVESNQGAILAFHSQATFQITVFQNSGVSVTPTITVKHAGSQDNWTSPVTDVNAQNMAVLANSAQQTIAYTFNDSSGMENGVEVSIDFGNNWGTSGKNIVIYAGFDLRSTPGVATGINNSPPTSEIRDPATDLVWNERFYSCSYKNGEAGGTSDHTNMVGSSPAISGAGVAPVFVHFPVEMRAVPTLTWWDGAGNASKVSTQAFSGLGAYTDNVAAAVAPNNIGTKGFSFIGNNGANVTSFIHYCADATIIGG